MITIAEVKLDVVDNFLYLGDCICPVGGWELATIKICCFTREKFRELLPLLTRNAIYLSTPGQIYNSCFRGTMLYSSECWARRQERLERR